MLGVWYTPDSLGRLRAWAHQIGEPESAFAIEASGFVFRFYGAVCVKFLGFDRVYSVGCMV